MADQCERSIAGVLQTSLELVASFVPYDFALDCKAKDLYNISV